MNLVLIPIEIPDREFQAKIKILAQFLTQHGFTVLFGDQNYLLKLFPYCTNTVLIWKNINCSKTKSVIKYAQKNQYVLHHEEGFIDWHDEVIKNVDPDLFDKASYIFTWGDYQKTIYDREFKQNSSKVFTVGHPRLDLSVEHARPPIGNKRVRSILINSRFANINHRLGVDYFTKSLGKYIGNHDLAQRIVNQASRDFEIFKNIIQYLDEKSNLDVVIRPHPSEDPRILRNRIGPLKNCRYESGGDVNTAIHKADIVIANQCHTQFEAALQEKTVLVIRDPMVDEKTLTPWIDEISGHLVSCAADVESFLELPLAPTINKQIIIENPTICTSALFETANIKSSVNEMLKYFQKLAVTSNFEPSQRLRVYLSLVSFINKLRKKLAGKNAEYYNSYTNKRIRRELPTSRIDTVISGRVWLMSKPQIK